MHEGLKHLALLLVLALACGCANRNEMHFKPGTGDAAQFILQQVIARGGQPITTNSLPTINSPWRYAEDQYGIVVRLPRADYDTVEALLRQTLGTPKFGPSETDTGGRLGGYRLSPQGGSLQFGYETDGSQVIILRQLTKQEAADGFNRAMKELGDSK